MIKHIKWMTKSEFLLCNNHFWERYAHKCTNNYNCYEKHQSLPKKSDSINIFLWYPNSSTDYSNSYHSFLSCLPNLTQFDLEMHQNLLWIIMKHTKLCRTVLIKIAFNISQIHTAGNKKWQKWFQMAWPNLFGLTKFIILNLKF